VHNYKQVYLQWIICIFIQIIFINIQNLQHKTLSCSRLRQLEIKMSLSVIHCMSSDSIWEWTAGTSTQQIHSSGVVIEEQLPCSVLQTVTFLFPTALTDMFFTSACTSSGKMLVPLTTRANKWVCNHISTFYSVCAFFKFHLL
jgi:glutathionyl-hydroquinone reductase